MFGQTVRAEFEVKVGSGMKKIQGKPVSPGYARGPAVIFGGRAAREVPRQKIDSGSVEEEQERFENALERSAADLESLQERVSAEVGRDEAEIFAAHLAMLRDGKFLEKVKGRIRHDLINAEYAVSEEIEKLKTALAGVKGGYLGERAIDVEDVGRRLIRHLCGGFDPETIPADAVIVAEELTPSDTLNVRRDRAAAIVTERGGITSHAAILARSLGIPAVTGLAGLCSMVSPGEEILVDGGAGVVVISPGARETAEIVRSKTAYDRKTGGAIAGEARPCVTRDNVRISLMANIGRPEEAAQVARHHLDGVGLFRTEYLFLEADEPPDVSRQAAAYRSAAESLTGAPLVIRTLDLGGDKKPRFLEPKFERNPNLGMRGLRFSLLEGEMLPDQLRAVCEVAREFDVRVLFPMVLGARDFAAALDVLSQAAAAAGAPAPPAGALVETPSSVFEIDDILERADFVSVGTNDLVQFMLAADRNAVDMVKDDSVLEPGVLRAVSKVVRSARQAGKPVSVCGEAAGNPHVACLLVGLGVRILSMSPVRAARVGAALRRSRCGDLEDAAARALECRDRDEMARILSRAIGET